MVVDPEAAVHRRHGLFAVIGVACLVLPACQLVDDIAGASGGARSTEPVPAPIATLPPPPLSAETPPPSPVQTPPAPASPAPQPAPPASPRELKGWELTESNTGLAAVGLSCDELPRYTGGEKVPAGATISEKRIETTLDLSAGNITVERSCIRPHAAGRGLPLVTTTDNNRCDASGCAPPPAQVILRDCEIDGSLVDNFTVAYSLGFGGIGSVERCYIHDVGSGIGVYGQGTPFDALAVGNYITRLRAWGDPGDGGSHNDGLTIRDFANPAHQVIIKNNRIVASSGNDTGALFIQPNDALIDNVLIEGNLLDGNGYQLGLEAANGFIYGRSMRAINNRFSGTGFGAAYVSTKGLEYGWAEWRDNYIDDPAEPDNRGRPVPEP
jgi:hypothetical protein